MKRFYYQCTNRSCEKYNIKILGCEKICPLCGVETIVYLRMPKPIWEKIIYVLSIAILVSCIIGVIFCFFIGIPICPQAMV